jgi:hypothetical protein
VLIVSDPCATADGTNQIGRLRKKGILFYSLHLTFYDSCYLIQRLWIDFLTPLAGYFSHELSSDRSKLVSGGGDRHRGAPHPAGRASALHRGAWTAQRAARPACSMVARFAYAGGGVSVSRFPTTAIPFCAWRISVTSARLSESNNCELLNALLIFSGFNTSSRLTSLRGAVSNLAVIAKVQFPICVKRVYHNPF